MPHGKQYFIIFLDNWGNHLYVDLFATKDQALPVFRSLHKLWEVKFGVKMVALQVDGGGEFMQYLEENGIQ